jgi:hypothetical protein
VLSVVALAVAAAACREREKAEEITVDTVAVTQVTAVPAAAPAAAPSGHEGEQGTAITTTNRAVVMALVGDRIVVHLSDSIVGKVRSAFDSGAARDSGSLGGMIARMAQSAVGSALSTPVAYPLDEIEDASYDGEAIHFRFRDGSKRAIESTKVDNRPLLASFAPDDARRFVEAVRVAKGRRTEAR